MNPIQLLKRLVAGRALTAIEHDENLEKIETTVNELVVVQAAVLREDGTLLDNAVDRAEVVKPGVLELNHFKAYEEWAGRFLRVNSAGVIEAVSPDQLVLPRVFEREEFSSIQLAGDQHTNLHQWTIPSVPKGGIYCTLRLHAQRNGDVPAGGTVLLYLGDAMVGMAPTHPLSAVSPYSQQLIMIHGILPNHLGGDLSVRVAYETDEANSNITFGVSGDGRFGRSLKFVAGLAV